MDAPAIDEVNNVLQNGIYVETSKGYVCMSLNDALSCNMNLSADDLKNLAAELILQQQQYRENVVEDVGKSGDSDGQMSDDPVQNLALGIVPNLENLPAKTFEFLPVLPSISDVNSSSENNMNSCVSDSDVSIVSSNLKVNQEEINQNFSASDIEIPNVNNVKLPVKKRGGWPKGRKRKPELLHLPPKAPHTGYNLYLNEQRKHFKGSSLVFHEITKIIGNKWSSLTLEEKKPYLEKAEEEKRRYREELRKYRQSGAYQMYLAKKRKKRMQYNVLSESDMDATDDFDEEDNEELFCRTCDQWFHNLHNKREHLQSKQHLKSVAGDISREISSDYDTDCMGHVSSLSFSTSLDESSLDGAPLAGTVTNLNVSDAISNLVAAVTKRQREIKGLKINLQQSAASHEALCQQLGSLRERESKLRNDLLLLKEREKEMEMKVFQLWQVPSWFIIDKSTIKGDVNT